MRRPRIVAAALALLALYGCDRAPERTAAPALWEVSAPDGGTGYVFGTVHALPDGLAWKTARIDGAIGKADRLVLEIVDPADADGARAVFERLASTPGQPPLESRIAPDLRDELRAALAHTRLQPQQFATLEDWAAALTLSFAIEARDGFDPENGADRALQAEAGDRPVIGLETLEGQLGLFDTLPTTAQRALLEAVVAEADDREGSKRLVAAWARGDMAALDREARTGMMASPQLRETLLVARNRAWVRQVAAMLKSGKRPFVAVGAAHVAGSDGLPALLAAQGYEVTRIQ